jgi:RNase P/RNase MRP subunit p29
MPWPDIFFKARRKPVASPEPDVSVEVAPEGPANGLANDPGADLAATPEAAPLPISKPPPLRTTSPSQTPSLPMPPPLMKDPPPPDRDTRTIPVVHGVVLRPPTGRLVRAASGSAPAPAPSPKPLKNIEQLMAEADPVRALSQSGGLRMVRRVAPESLARDAQVPGPGPSAVPVKTEVITLPDVPQQVSSPLATPTAPPPPPASAPVIDPAARSAPMPAPSPWPTFQPKTPAPIEMKKIDFQADPSTRIEPAAKVEAPRATAPPRAVPTLTPPGIPTVAKAPEAPLRTTVSLTSSRPGLVGPPPMISVVGRRAKMADVARIVLPPKREETQPLPPSPPESSSTVVPPSFSVPGATGRLLGKPSTPRPDLAAVAAALESPFMDRTSRSEPKSDTAKLPEPRPDAAKLTELKPETAKIPDVKPETATLPEAEPDPLPKLTEAKDVASAPSTVQTDFLLSETKVEAKVAGSMPPDSLTHLTPSPPPAAGPAPRVDPEVHASPPQAATNPVPEAKVDPEAHKPPAALTKQEEATPARAVSPESTTSERPTDRPVEKPEAPVVESAKTEPKLDAPVPEPVIDPEAHQPPPAPATAETQAKVDAEAHKPKTEIVPRPEPREFHLTNGERVAGIVLSETPESVYVEHATLGVLTIPRGEIAKRLVEIILLNGDRIVGDIMAETAEMLYVRHASLGMLSVPRAQRSTRVVEAILKDGDRILGELLAETEAFTVIKSSTLGTVTVPHDKIAMLNRKVEQIEMKTLPTGPAQLPG